MVESKLSSPIVHEFPDPSVSLMNTSSSAPAVTYAPGMTPCPGGQVAVTLPTLPGGTDPVACTRVILFTTFGPGAPCGPAAPCGPCGPVWPRSDFTAPLLSCFVVSTCGFTCEPFVMM